MIILIFTTRLGPVIINQGQTCIQQQDQPSLSCKIITDNQIFARNLELDIGISLKQLKNVESQVEKINDLMTNSKNLYRKCLYLLLFYILFFK